MRHLTVIFACLVIFLPPELYAQQPRSAKNNSYRAWIYSTNNRLIQTGYLYALEDSMLALAVGSMPATPLTDMRTIPIREVDQMKFQKAGSSGQGAAIGAAAGFGLGFIIGFASSSPSEGLVIVKPEVAALATGAIMAIPGAVIGALAGGTKITIPIGGDPLRYGRQKKELEKYLLKN